MVPMPVTERVVLREWGPDDVDDAFAVYGTATVTDWLVPSMPRVADLAAMRRVLSQWIEEQRELPPPLGRWAFEHRESGEVIGGAELRLLPPHLVDVEVAWHLRPNSWGQGYAKEATRELIRWAFAHEAVELFAVVDPLNDRAHRTAQRLGMEWVGETTKYYDRTLHVYRIRPGDLD
ncbi:GNAT family N-acetyltransferase [Saccharopolyspora gloriosae]|uniref:RimJ/RimL family protein N-acetyltransferase n=1 Tax=Saccharopolyspora gloriosae TaxID=455344 RepID=A0A840NIE6_9PSEU|nr:RimJ/RimL family protein N-acetyltransferase [Saccharopolyspora gloriosae]